MALGFKFIRTFSFLKFLILLLMILSSLSCKEQRTLRVSLYPYIPNAADLYWKLETEFEKLYPEIELSININENYYDHRPEKGGILFEKADLYEIDSVFLVDFIKKNKIRPLTPNIVPKKEELLPIAKIAYQNNKWYGYPHWVCRNFLFYRKNDTLLSKIISFKDIEQLIKQPTLKSGLLIDLKGTSTLGEMYLDSLMDNYQSVNKVIPYLKPSNIDKNIIKLMNRAIGLTVKNFGRDDKYHDRFGFYARQFSRGNGRAFVGYSEQLYYMIMETKHSCRFNEKCIQNDGIEISEWPFSDNGSLPIGWVDMFVIDANVTGEKLKDIEKFIHFITSDKSYYEALIPGWGEAPRYLLPPKIKFYKDKSILKEAPLYLKLYPLIEKAIPVSLEGLNENLRKIGKKLDQDLLKN